MPKLAQRPPEPDKTALLQALEQQGVLLKTLISAIELLGREVLGLREWVETAVNRPWELAGGAPKGRDDSDIPF